MVSAVQHGAVATLTMHFCRWSSSLHGSSIPGLTGGDGLGGGGSWGSGDSGDGGDGGDGADGGDAAGGGGQRPSPPLTVPPFAVHDAQYVWKEA